MIKMHRSVAGTSSAMISFLLDGAATADVFALAGTEYVRWDRDQLIGLMAKSHRLLNAISALFIKDIARKLSVSWPLPDVNIS